MIHHICIFCLRSLSSPKIRQYLIFTFEIEKLFKVGAFLIRESKSMAGGYSLSGNFVFFANNYYYIVFVSYTASFYCFYILLFH